MSNLEHIELNKEECERLVRLLKWVGIACQNTKEEEEFLKNIQYKLRSQMKRELRSDRT